MLIYFQAFKVFIAGVIYIVGLILLGAVHPLSHLSGCNCTHYTREVGAYEKHATVHVQ